MRTVICKPHVSSRLRLVSLYRRVPLGQRRRQADHSRDSWLVDRECTKDDTKVVDVARRADTTTTTFPPSISAPRTTQQQRQCARLSTPERGRCRRPSSSLNVTATPGLESPPLIPWVETLRRPSPVCDAPSSQPPSYRQCQQSTGARIESMDDTTSQKNEFSSWSDLETRGGGEADLASLPAAVRAIVEECRVKSTNPPPPEQQAGEVLPYPCRMYEESIPGEEGMLQLQWMRLDVSTYVDNLQS